MVFTFDLCIVVFFKTCYKNPMQQTSSVCYYFVKIIAFKSLIKAVPYRTCIRVKLIWDISLTTNFSNLNQLGATTVREYGLLQRALIISTLDPDPDTMKERYKKCINVNGQHFDNDCQVSHIILTL